MCLKKKRRNPGDVGVADAPALLGELVDGGLDVGRVPQRDGIQRQAEGAEPFLLFVPMGFPDFVALAMADAPSQPVAELLTIKLGEDAAALIDRHTDDDIDLACQFIHTACSYAVFTLCRVGGSWG